MMTDLTGELMSVFGVVSIVLHDGHDAMRIDRLPGGESQVVSLASDPLNSVLPFEAGLWMDGWSDLSEAEIKRRILECRRVFRVALGVTVKLGSGRNREWWERLFIAGGFRRHPLSQLLTPYVELEQEQGDTTLVFERIPDTAVATHPPELLARDRDLHMDMLRESGIRSDAHLARYIFARGFVKPGMVVLDAACGLGYGSAILSAGTGVKRVHGVDLSDSAIRYARLHYGSVRPCLEFHAGDATRIAALPDASVDLVVSFETLEHMPNPEALLREFNRVLRPQGLWIGSVPNLWIDDHGRNPVPFHFHIYDHAQFRDQVGRWFSWRELHRQNAGGGWKRPQGRNWKRLEECSPSAEDQRDAEWWLGVASKEATPEKVIAVSSAPANSGEPKSPGSLGPSTRIVVLDEEARHREIYGAVFERLGVRAECAYGRPVDEILDSHPSLILLSREWTEEWRLVAAGARRLGIPVVYVMDGVIEWSYVWNNLSHIRGHGTFLQPLLASDLCVIGRHPARILSALGVGARAHVVGLPRLDGYDRRRTIEAGTRPRILIATARTSGHDTEQQVMALRALRDLKEWFTSNPCADVIWRIAGDLAEELGVKVDLQGSLSDALGRSSALITFPSTCALEGMLKGMPVAQVDYRPLPSYVETGWFIRSADHIPNVVHELIHPPAARLAHQDACLVDELEPGDATERLVEVIQAALTRPGLPEAGLAPTVVQPGGRLDFRLVHPELTVFAAAPTTLLQYELDAAHRALRRVKAERMEERRRIREIAEAVTGADLADLEHWSLIDHFSEARLDAMPPGSASVGQATLAGWAGRTIFLHPPARLTFIVPVAAAGRFTFAVGLHPDVWGNPQSGPCEFRVTVDGRLVSEIIVDPVNVPSARRWVRGEALVPAVSGTTGVHRIDLCTRGIGGDAFRWALWRSPIFTWLRSEEAAGRGDSYAHSLPELPDHYQPGRTIP